MIEINKNLRIIKRQSYNGETWICQELFPAETWKNRQVWKPITRPLYKTEVQAWLTRRSLESAALEQFNHSFS